MEPRNKAQEYVVGLSASVRPISESQIRFGTLHSFTKEERGSKKHLKRYFVISSRVKDMQLVRFFSITKIRQSYDIIEPLRLWFDSCGRMQIEAMNRLSFCARYVDQWINNSDRTLKPVPRFEYNDYTLLLPVSCSKITSCIPILMRNGLRRSFHDIQPRDVIQGLLANNKFETLWKCKQFKLIKCFAYKWNSAYRNPDKMSAVMIVLRHHYVIKDTNLWDDMVDMLISLHKDTHNPKFVCPDNLVEAHNRVLAMSNMRLQAERRIFTDNERLRDIRINHLDKKYVSRRKRFYDMKIADDKISITVLRTVGDFKNEAEAMHHCLFQCEYYKKPDSLIMSARKNGKRIETVEVDLSRYEVNQCYGACDKFTSYHKEIVDLVKNNMNVIRQYNSLEI